MKEIKDELRNDLFEYLLRLGDDRLILGHRLSEWCGHAPILEEDIALANIALDCIGQANAFLSIAAEVENKNRTEDDLAYFRDEIDFRNLQLVEQPNIDFAYTIVRQFFVDAFAVYYYEELSKSMHEELAGIAAKSLKEAKYHLRHSRQWVLRLGDGTDESHVKIQNAVDNLWIFTGEMFFENEVDKRLIEEKLVPSVKQLEPKWVEVIESTFKEATLKIPEEPNTNLRSGREGVHTEYLGHILAEMQIVARSHPGAKW
jgi:ring-1,2-phenylacetyl-CoA epoxidase subunit PaaC